MDGSMEYVYANYAATSPFKPPEVEQAVMRFLGGKRTNSLRDVDGLSQAKEIFQSREKLAELLGVKDSSQVIFTSGATLSLNMVINGLVRPGCHIITSSVEHNAVARPLQRLVDMGVAQVSWMPCDPEGRFQPESIREYIQKNTTILILTHASNVLGTILPITECFQIAKKYGLITVLDAAQTLGVLPVSLDCNTDAICFTGHKGLKGLAGTGGFALSEEGNRYMKPWLSGGTGSLSDSLQQPTALPDKYEPGTPNLMGIAALGAACEVILEKGIEPMRTVEIERTNYFLEQLSELPLEVKGTGIAELSTSIVSVVSPHLDSVEFSQILYDSYGIVTRGGLHCSPLAHQTAHTFPQGTTRFSFSERTTQEEIDYIVASMRNILRSYRA